MKRRIVLSIFIVIAAAILYFLQIGITLNDKKLPPLASFFSPFTGFWQNAEGTNISSKNISLKGFEGNATIKYDQRGVPHIFASNLKDLFFAQGFVTAKDRLWQMDISTRASSGRLAEVLGENLIERDLGQRRKGLMRAAELTLATWKKDTEGYAYIEAYVDGVNAYIESLDADSYPLEFKLLNYTPEKWSVLKAAQFYKSMEETLNGKAFDLENDHLVQTFGKATYDYLYPEWNPKQSPVIPDQYSSNPLQENIAPEAVHLPSLLSSGEMGYQDDDTQDFLGSNNWAVNPQKTSKGKAILCNDPHLRLSLPSIWYEAQLSSPEINAYGVTFPGIPGVIIGFNEHAAWGSTNGSQDVKDYYKIQWTNDKKTHYILDGKEVPVESYIETIKVKDQADILDTVKYTIWGPVMAKDSRGNDLAMHWIANDTTGAFVWKTFWGFDKSKNLQDFDKGASYFGHPIQNFIFAATNGDIGLKVSRLIPLKDKEAGTIVMDGSNSSNAWKGFVPDSLNPKSFNPERGFVSSANQHSTYPSYPFYYNGHFNDYRGRYINRRLAEMENITVEDMKALQNNNYSILAEDAMPVLLNLVQREQLDVKEKGILELMEKWDYRFEAADPTPAIFVEWFDHLEKLTWDEMTAIQATGPIRYPENWRLIQLLQEDPLNVFFDIQSTEARENPNILVTRAFKETLGALSDKLEDPNFSWSDYRNTSITHLARIDAFSHKMVKTGGFKESINAVQSGAGPSWRMIVEMDETPKGYGVYPGGQSGNPGSPFYDNFIEDWAKGNYYELLFLKNENDRGEDIIATINLK
ncbi:MAG: penicillin acylase family protein [Saprospiraceae bacterium]|nr:penicillin acylase family protein [Saprospiraceae bacterium]